MLPGKRSAGDPIVTDIPFYLVQAGAQLSAVGLEAIEGRAYLWRPLFFCGLLLFGGICLHIFQS